MTEQYGVINEFGVGFTPLSESEQKQLKEEDKKKKEKKEEE